MEQLLQQIEIHKKEIEAYQASDANAVEEFRIKWLGTKGILKDIMGEMKNVPNEKKKEFGQLLNEFKLFVESRYELLKKTTNNHQPATSNQIDLSLPGDPMPLGSRHPITLMR